MKALKDFKIQFLELIGKSIVDNTENFKKIHSITSKIQDNKDIELFIKLDKKDFTISKLLFIMLSFLTLILPISLIFYFIGTLTFSSLIAINAFIVILLILVIQSKKKIISDKVKFYISLLNLLKERGDEINSEDLKFSLNILEKFNKK